MDVKNNIVKPFDTIFLIVFGFILTEHINNIVKLYINGCSDSTKFLGITLFAFMFFSICETVLDYSTAKTKIDETEVYPTLLRHTLWFLQFFPIYFIVNIFADHDITTLLKSESIAISMGLVYLVYFLINVVKMFSFNSSIPSNDRKIEKDKIIVHMVLYGLFSIIYFITDKVFFINQIDSELVLSTIIIIGLIFYFIYWKNYYYEKFFDKKI